MPKEKWKPEPWMERPLKAVGLTFERAEEVMNCTGRDCNVEVNAPRAMMCCHDEAVVWAIIKINKAGLLA